MTKRLIIVFFVFIVHYAFAVDLINVPPIVYSVNVTTGEYYDARQDVAQITPAHLASIRSYTSSAGWKNVSNNTVTLDENCALTYSLDSNNNLSSVSLNGTNLYQYQYQEQTPLITSWSAADGSSYSIAYNEAGQVKEISGMVANSDNPQVIASYAYSENRTDVIDAMGLQRSFYYDQNNCLSKLEEYSGSTIYRCQQIYWIAHPTQKSWLIRTRTWEDGQGHAFLCATYTYDGMGNRITEVLHRNTNGDHLIPLDMDGQGNLSTPAKTTYSKRWTYTNSETPLILTHDEDNGSHAEYQYDPILNKATSIFMGDGKQLHKRWFTDYDSEGHPISLMVDNGSNRDRSSNEGVTQRQYMEYTYIDTPSKRQIATVATSVETPQTNGKLHLYNTINIYDAQGRQTSSTTSDLTGNLIERSTNIFTPNGLQRSTTNPQTTSSTTYDLWGRPVVMTSGASVAGTPESTQYSYDNAGNLIVALTTDAKGVVTATQHTYNAMRLKTSTVSSTSTTSYEYDAQHRLIKETTIPYDPTAKGISTTYEYDLFDNIVSEQKSDILPPPIPAPSCSLDKSAHWLWGTWSSLKSVLSVEDQLGQEIQEEAKDFFDETLAGMFGLYDSLGTFGLYNPGKEVNPKVKITVINGILNLRETLVETILQLTESHDENQIYFVYRPTEGWTRDILNCTFAKLGIMVTPSTYMLVELWRELIKEMGGVNGGGTILHYAHSIGATDTYAAALMLTPEERKMIKLVVIGTPSLIPTELNFKEVDIYISVRDGVGLIGLITSPIRWAKAVFSHDPQIHFVGTYWGIPLADHLLTQPAYREVIEILGEKFLEEYALEIDCIKS